MFKKILLFIAFSSTALLLGGCSRQLAETGNVQGQTDEQIPVATPLPNPLSLAALKVKTYDGSDIKIESELPETATYRQYLASYQSDGLKINGLLTVPKGTPPEGGWPAIIFNHGYIPPEQYRTTERYEAYVGGFASRGFVVFKPDYRGHGSSEGQPTGAYFSPGYTIDVLNALASVRKLPEVNKDRIGMWGHSMGGSITLRVVSVDPSIKAAVIWGGVVADYPEFIQRWSNRRPWRPSPRENSASRSTRAQFVAQYGTPEENPTFWQSISPWAELSNLQTPIQLHHARADESVPWQFSESLYNKLQALGKPSELYLYDNSNHNLSGAAFSQAMSRSVQFFQAHL